MSLRWWRTPHSTVGCLVGILIVAPVGWWIFDGLCIPRIETHTDPLLGVEITTEYRKRFGPRPLEQRWVWPDGRRESGPVSRSGKRHGRWLSYGGGLPPRESWWWYGEPVSEGRFHELD